MSRPARGTNPTWNGPGAVSVRVDDFEGFEPDPAALRVVTDYLVHSPEQGGWDFEDHCEGLAGGILCALHEAGWVMAKLGGTGNITTPLAQAARDAATVGG